MTPELDPRVCALISDAVEKIAGDAETPHPMNLARYKATRGYVPRRVAARLHGLIQGHGFTMLRTSRLAEQYGPGCLGATTGDWDCMPPDERMLVQIARGLTPASEIRTMAHECAHIILGHVGLSKSQARQIMVQMLTLKRLGLPTENPDEEAAVELAAAAFCEVAGFKMDYSQSAAFIYRKLHGRPVKPEVREAAKLAARVLYRAARPALGVRAA